MDIYILFGKYFVDIGSRAAQLGSKPRHTASLFAERFPDKVSRMNHCPDFTATINSKFRRVDCNLSADPEPDVFLISQSYIINTWDPVLATYPTY